MADFELKATLPGHQNPIFALEGIVGASILYSAGNDKGVVEWDLERMIFNRILCSVPASVYALHHIPDTTYLAIGMRNGEIYIVDYTVQKLVAKLQVEMGAVFCIKSLKNKQELIATGEEGKAYVWDLATFSLLYCFNIAKHTVRTFAISDDETMIVFGDKEGSLHLFDALDYHCVISQKRHERAISSLCFVGKDVLSGGRDAKLIQSTTPTFTIKQEVIPHMFTVYGIVQLYPSTEIVTVSRDKTIKVWSEDLKLAKNISVDRGYDAHRLSINTVYFDSFTQRLYTAGDDKLLKVWQVG